MTGRQRVRAANEGETLSPWLPTRCEGRCRYQSIHWNKWERCGVEANENDSVSQCNQCHPFFFFLFFKDRGGNLITYFQLAIISTPGLMQYLQSHTEHGLTGAHPEIIYTPVVCLWPWSVFHIFLQIEKVILPTALWVGILNRILMFFTIWTNWIDALSGWLIYSISAEMKRERDHMRWNIKTENSGRMDTCEYCSFYDSRCNGCVMSYIEFINWKIQQGKIRCKLYITGSVTRYTTYVRA